ncbi:MAG: AI-2E family transporter [bacterium]
MQLSSRDFSLQIPDRQIIPLGRVLVAILILALTILAFYLLSDLITPVVISIFLAYLLEPLVNGLENRGISRGWGILIVLLGFIAVIGTGVMMVREQMADELDVILSQVRLDQPDLLLAQMQEKLKAAFPGTMQSRLIDLTITAAAQLLQSFLGTGLASMTEIFSAFGATIIIPFLVFFILNDARALEKAIVQNIPNRYFEMSLSLFHKASRQLGRYIRGVLLDAAIVGAMVMIALTILDLRYAVFIGILAGMANLIPYLGPVVGGIPAIAISIMDSGNFSGVPSVLLAFAIVKIIDDVIVQPIVVSKSVELHPVAVIIAIYVGGHAGGILGMIVAVPLVAIVKESLRILHWGFTKYYIFRQPHFAEVPIEDTFALVYASGHAGSAKSPGANSPHGAVQLPGSINAAERSQPDNGKPSAEVQQES